MDDSRGPKPGEQSRDKDYCNSFGFLVFCGKSSKIFGEMVHYQKDVFLIGSSFLQWMQIIKGLEHKGLAHLDRGKWCISLMGLVFILATSKTRLDEINHRSAHSTPKEAFSSSMDSTSNANMPPARLLCQPCHNS